MMGENDWSSPATIELLERARGGNRCVSSRMVPRASHGLTVVQNYQGRPFRRAISEDFLSVLGGWVPGATACAR